MVNVFQAVEDFQVKYGQDVNVPINLNNLHLRIGLISEEYKEVYREILDKNDCFTLDIDKQALTKELADLIYVTVGMAVTYGLPLEEVFKRTHESNMTKTGDKNTCGKVLKGADYVPPVLEDLFND